MQPSRNIVIYIFLLIILNEQIFSRKTLNFLQAKVDFNTKYLSDHTVKVGDDRVSLDIVLNIARNFTQDPWVEAALHLKMAKGENSYRSLVSYNINVCNILGKNPNGQMNMLLAWINNFWKYGTLPKSCPMLKGNYNWNGLHVDKNSLPSFLRSGKYRTLIKTYFRKSETDDLRESVANVTIYLQLK